MASMLHKFVSVWTLASRVPLPLRSEPDFSEADIFMPVVGLAAGLVAVAGTLSGLALFGRTGTGPMLAALSGMTLQYYSFNAFHLDGLLDTADAAGAMGPVDKRRQALKDPRIGSFALLAGFMTLAARTFAVSGIVASGKTAAWGALLLAPVAGRYSAMLIPALFKPYRGGEPGTASATTGLADTLGNGKPVRASIGYALSAICGAMVTGATFGTLGVMASMLIGGFTATAIAAFTGAWYARNMDGYSGDALGAAVELTELALLLIAAAIIR